MFSHRSPGLAPPSQIKTHSSKRLVCSALFAADPSLLVPSSGRGLQQPKRGEEGMLSGCVLGVGLGGCVVELFLLEWVLICVLIAEDAAGWCSWWGHRCFSAHAQIHSCNTHTKWRFLLCCLNFSLSVGFIFILFWLISLFVAGCWGMQPICYALFCCKRLQKRSLPISIDHKELGKKQML